MARLGEDDRLAALAAYGVLDTAAEPGFDDITRLAAQLCEVPIALVSLIDRDRQWFKSCVGLDVQETPRAFAFCAHAILREGPFVVPDAHADPRFAQNPLVTGPPHIRYYAGFPLIDADGAALGTLCVIDVRPRHLDDRQMAALRVLARQVVAHLALRKVTRRLRDEVARHEEAARARAELLARETSLRLQIELAHRRAAFLAEAGRLLGASLDIDRTFEAVARLAVPMVADLCSIMVEEAGSLRRVAEAGGDSAGEGEIRRLREQPKRDAPLAMRQAMDERRPILMPDYRQWLAERLPAQHPYLEAVVRLDVTSAIVAPMVIGGRVLGLLNLAVQRKSGRLYDEGDLATMTEMAQRAAMALDNARLFGDAHRERARAEEANRTKDEFLAAVSHDLRTPLNAILGWTQILRRRSDPDTQSRAIAVIERSVRSQSQLIEDLLDISRMATGQLHVEREPVDLVAVAEAALEAVRPTAEARGVRIETTLDPAATHGVGDFGRLQQVVWNLVSNAIKFSRSGGCIEVRLEPAGNEARLTVKDDGRGITPDLLPHIFERFRQDSLGVGRRAGGLGLGLAIAKHIVDTLGGSISAASEGEGRGATFTVLLPRATAVPTAKRAFAGSGADPGEVEVKVAGLRGVRVLIVDDDPETRTVLGEFLSAHDMPVSTAASAEEGYAVFRRERPDLLVSDVMMPGASGYDLVRRLRDLPPQDGGRTPALALTASTGALDRTRALAAGFDLYVPKPVVPSELLAVLASLRRDK